MKINKEIKGSLGVLDQISEVEISSSFKQDVLAKALISKKENTSVISFTPSLQMAATVIILLVNIAAVMYSFSVSSTETDIDSFAQEYNIGTTSKSIIN